MDIFCAANVSVVLVSPAYYICYNRPVLILFSILAVSLAVEVEACIICQRSGIAIRAVDEALPEHIQRFFMVNVSRAKVQDLGTVSFSFSFDLFMHSYRFGSFFFNHRSRFICRTDLLNQGAGALFQRHRATVDLQNSNTSCLQFPFDVGDTVKVYFMVAHRLITLQFFLLKFKFLSNWSLRKYWWKEQINVSKKQLYSNIHRKFCWNAAWLKRWVFRNQTSFYLTCLCSVNMA